MRNIKNFTAVRDLVRQGLGCGCPEEVFDEIDLSRIEPDQDRPAMKRLLIGRRLLIRILPCDDPAALERLLPPLLRELRQERDRLGYNRVRLVIAATDPASLQPAAGLLFQAQTDVDERMHLHILPADRLSDIE